MARSSAAPVPPPAQRRKRTQAGTRHASHQTHRRPARRSSGPANGRSAAQKRPVAATPAPRRRPAAAPLVQRLAHGRTGALIDRLLRGRACVALVFALLVGIVFSNVSLLELNKGIAQTSAEATAIEQENAQLRRQVAPLASSERIQAEAVRRGYSLPAAGDVTYIRGSVKSNAKRAAGRMTAPGMGEGTASRPAAQVQEEQQAQSQATTTAAPAPTPAAPQPLAAPPTPVASAPQAVQATPVAGCQPPAATGCQPPAAGPTAPPTTTVP